MLRIHEPKELFSRLLKGRATGFGIPIIILVCSLAQTLPAFGQCAVPSFAPASNFAGGDGPNNMAVGDFNGDGKFDLAVPNINADRVSILLGNGTGSFTLGGSFLVGHQPTYTAAADFNGDGKVDLAVVNNTSFGNGDMSILIGNGAGGFGAATSYRVIAFNNSVTVSDLNNDGQLDIVAGTYSENLGNVKVLLGDGTGSFGATADFGGNGDGYSAVVGDFNSDGQRDVAIAINSEVGSINFATGTKIQVLLGDGSGRLGAPTNFTVGTGPTSIAVGDLNGDGKLDLAVANFGSNNVSVLLGNGAGGFGVATNFPADPANIRQGGVTYPLPFADFPKSVAVGDLNSDGKPDLAVSNAFSGTVSVLLGNGTGGFSSPTNFTVGTRPVSVVLSDFNGDGKKDLALANFGSDDVSVLINTCSSAAANPIDSAQFFVRQQYLDFLSREPEVGEPWTAILNNCSDVNSNPACDRLTVSAAFFGSPEFQLKGYFVYRFYKLAFNRLPAYDEIDADMRAVTGQSPTEVFERKAAFTNVFVQRTESTNTFNAMTNAQYVATLLGRYGLTQITTPDPAAPDGTNKVTLTNADLTSKLDANTLTRAAVLRSVADSDEVFTAEFNQAFVAMQYYGYLRRRPETAGFDAWLNYLNAYPTDFRTMVNGFVNSIEYRTRFGQP